MNKLDRNTVTRELMPWAGGPEDQDCGCRWQQITRRSPDLGAVTLTWELTSRCRMHTISGLVE